MENQELVISEIVKATEEHKKQKALKRAKMAAWLGALTVGATAMNFANNIDTNSNQETYQEVDNTVETKEENVLETAQSDVMLVATEANVNTMPEVKEETHPTYEQEAVIASELRDISIPISSLPNVEKEDSGIKDISIPVSSLNNTKSELKDISIPVSSIENSEVKENTNTPKLDINTNYAGVSDINIPVEFTVDLSLSEGRSK